MSDTPKQPQTKSHNGPPSSQDHHKGLRGFQRERERLTLGSVTMRAQGFPEGEREANLGVSHSERVEV